MDRPPNSLILLPLAAAAHPQLRQFLQGQSGRGPTTVVLDVGAAQLPAVAAGVAACKRAGASRVEVAMAPLPRWTPQQWAQTGAAAVRTSANDPTQPHIIQGFLQAGRAGLARVITWQLHRGNLAQLTADQLQVWQAALDRAPLTWVLAPALDQPLPGLQELAAAVMALGPRDQLRRSDLWPACAMPGALAVEPAPRQLRQELGLDFAEPCQDCPYRERGCHGMPPAMAQALPRDSQLLQGLMADLRGEPTRRPRPLTQQTPLLALQAGLRQAWRVELEPGEEPEFRQWLCDHPPGPTAWALAEVSLPAEGHRDDSPGRYAAALRLLVVAREPEVARQVAQWEAELRQPRLAATQVAQLHSAIGQAYGYPRCCTQAFVELALRGRDAGLSGQWNDMAVGLAQAWLRTQQPDVRVQAAAEPVGGALSPHLPCSGDCRASAELADALEALLLPHQPRAVAGYRRQRQLLSAVWPDGRRLHLGVQRRSSGAGTDQGWSEGWRMTHVEPGPDAEVLRDQLQQLREATALTWRAGQPHIADINGHYTPLIARPNTPRGWPLWWGAPGPRPGVGELEWP